jgi:hypothetical protein
MTAKKAICLCAIAMVAASCDAQPKKEARNMNIRQPVIAGSWYPGTAPALSAEIDKHLQAAGESGPAGRPAALIVPHAGYAYSGPAAAYSYINIVDKAVGMVILVGPSHRAYFDGVAAYAEGAWETPLGRVEIDEGLARALMARDPDHVKELPSAHAQEHSLEIQLPFLQRVLKPGFRIVPLMMFDHSLPACRRLAQALAGAVGDRDDVLLVASTDLSHFHSDEKAKRLDGVAAKRVANFDPEGLAGDLSAGKCEACGGGPMVAVMLAARELGADTAVVYKYQTSGDVTGDRSQVVGYLAAGFYKSKWERDKGKGEGRVKEASPGKEQGKLTEGERNELFRIARASVEAAVRKKARPDTKPLTTVMGEKRGVFVTLKLGGQLRGCIGYIEAIKPLCRAVAEMAAEAATGDPRFPPVSEKELPELEYEISVLTPRRQISDPSEFITGKHGIIVERDGRGGVFLPQVAPEQGWDRETTLSYLCAHKAGLPADAWRDKRTKLYVFEAEVLEEKGLK